MLVTVILSSYPRPFECVIKPRSKQSAELIDSIEL